MNGGLYRGNNTTSEKNERQTFTNKFSHVCECCFIRFFYFFELLFLGALLFSSFIVQFFICAPPACGCLGVGKDVRRTLLFLFLHMFDMKLPLFAWHQYRIYLLLLLPPERAYTSSAPFIDELFITLQC